MKDNFTIVGAGLAGALMACFLGRAGQRVRVFHPVSLAVNEKPSVLGRGKAGQVTLSDAYPGLNLVVQVKAGAVVDVRLGERERYTAITEPQARKLLED